MLFAPVALRASVPALVTEGVVTEVDAVSVVALVSGVVIPVLPLRTMLISILLNYDPPGTITHRDRDA
jgi:hypothetical protein